MLDNAQSLAADMETVAGYEAMTGEEREQYVSPEMELLVTAARSRIQSADWGIGVGTPLQPWVQPPFPQPWEQPYPTDKVWPGIAPFPPMPNMPQERINDALQKLLDDIKRKQAAKKDEAMLGDSGFARNHADFYPTPPENVDCLLTHIIPQGKIWEPACGDGAISKRLLHHGYEVTSTDLFDYGYGESGLDFLNFTTMPDGARTIITNPPYADMAEKFIKYALELTEPVKGQVCMFLRNEFDCGKGKMSLFGIPPFHKKIVVTKRPRWIEGSTGSPRHNYSWFCWDWRHIKGAASIVYSHPSKVSPVRGSHSA